MKELTFLAAPNTCGFVSCFIFLLNGMDHVMNFWFVFTCGCVG